MEKELYSLDDLKELELKKLKEKEVEEIITILKKARKSRALHAELISLISDTGPTHSFSRDTVLSVCSSLGFIPVFSDKDFRAWDVVITSDGWDFINAEE